MKIKNLLFLQLSPALQDIGLLVLRIVAGLSMLFGHGLGKMSKLFAGGEIAFADPFGLGATASLGMAVFAEIICAALIVVGLFTRLSTIPLIITMLVAYFTVHFADPFKVQEKAILYGIIYIALFFTGPGRYSLDAVLGNRR